MYLSISFKLDYLKLVTLYFLRQNHRISIHKRLVGSLVRFYGMSILVGYLMPNLYLCYYHPCQSLSLSIHYSWHILYTHLVSVHSSLAKTGMSMYRSLYENFTDEFDPASLVTPSMSCSSTLIRFLCLRVYQFSWVI